MKEEELNRLLEKYYSGESSENEERALKEFFQGNNIPEGYDAEIEIFRHYSLSENIPEPSFDFEDRIIAGIDDFERKHNPPMMRRVVLYSLSTAAGLIIIAGSYFFLNRINEPKDTFSDPKIAYAETMKILMEVSSKLNRGNQALEPLGRMNKMTNKSFESINKSTGIIERGMKSLNKLDKASDQVIKPAGMNKNK